MLFFNWSRSLVQGLKHVALSLHPNSFLLPCTIALPLTLLQAQARGKKGNKRWIQQGHRRNLGFDALWMWWTVAAFFFLCAKVCHVCCYFQKVGQQFSWCWERCLSDSQRAQLFSLQTSAGPPFSLPSYCSQLCWDPLAHMVVLLGKCSLKMNCMPPIPSMVLVEDSGIHQWMDHLPQV